MVGDYAARFAASFTFPYTLLCLLVGDMVENFRHLALGERIVLR